MHRDEAPGLSRYTDSPISALRLLATVQLRRLVVMALLMLSLPLSAATWDGGGADNNWATAANWVDDVAPVAGDTLVFAGTVRLAPNNNIAADTSFASITFNSGAGLFVIGGNRITLAGDIINNDDSVQTINLGMIMAATRTVNAASGNLAFGGILSGVGGGLTKTGAGTLTLGGANTFTGTTSVNGGTLLVSGSLAAGSAVTVNTGATLGGDSRSVAGTVTVANGGTLAPGGGIPVASFVASSLRAVTQNDWRGNQTITGTRADQIISQVDGAWGTPAERASFGIGGSDGNWDNFSVQWDGYLTVAAANTTLYTRSDDGSRVWLDLNNNDVIDGGEWGSNGWSTGQGTITRTVHASLAVGTYRMRVQYDEGTSGNVMHLLWTDAANSAGTITADINGAPPNVDLYVVPAANLLPPIIGTLTTGAVTFNGTSTYAVDLNGTTPTFDRVTSSGTVTCAGTLTVASIANAAVGKVYTIASGTSVTGTFSGLVNGTRFTQLGRFFRIVYNASTVTLTEEALRVWDGGGGDNNWTTAANWNLDVAPIAGDDVQFDGIVRLTPNNDFTSDPSFASITFGAGAGAFVIGGNSITLAGNVTNNDDSLQTINLAMIMASTRTFAATSGDLAIGGILSGPGGLTKSGAGTLTLSGTNTYTGATTVSVGTLLVTGSTAAGSAMAVASGSTLGGTGTVAGTITVANGGTLAPGTGGTTIATLNTGAVVFNATSTYAVDLNGTTPTCDRVTSSGTVTCAGTLTVASIVNAAVGKVYTIASGTSVTGTFSGLVNGTRFTQQGRAFRIAYTTTTVTLTDEALVWDGGGVNDNWTTAANWNLDVAPIAGDDVQFDGIVRLTPNNDFPAGTSFNSIIFNSGAGAFVIGSATVTGTISREVWTGVGGGNVANIPTGTTPNISDTLSSLEGPINWADNYGTRVRGFVTAPTTGNYTFWIASDDNSELWLSTDTLPANKLLIASVGDWTDSREWNKFASQKSVAIALTAGQKYYIEALQKDDAGGDNLAVGWDKPSDPVEVPNVPSEVIPGAQLSPYSELILGGSITNNSSNVQTINLGLHLAATRTVDCVTNAVVLGGTISGAGGLTKAGTGVLTLTGANTHTGATTVSAGTLLVTGSTHASSAVAVNSGGTLGGTGTVSGAITLASGGIIAPGAATGVSIGTLNTAGLTCTGGIYTVDLNGSTQAADRITSVSTVALGTGVVTLTVANIAGTSAVNNVYTIVSATTSVTGTFAGLVNGAMFTQQGRTFQIAYPGTTVTLTDVARPTTRTWDGGSLVDSNWTTKENWDNDLAPIAGDDLVFAGGLRLTPNNDFAADPSFASITFNTGAGAFTIGGNRITLAGAVTNNDDSVQTINLAMIMAATRTANAASGNLAFGGILSGAGGLTKTGANTLTLSGANAYTGSTTVTAGTLSFSANNNLNATGAIILNGGKLYHGTTATLPNAFSVTASSTIESDDGDDLHLTGNTISGTAGTVLSLVTTGGSSGALHTLFFLGSGFTYAGNITSDTWSRTKFDNVSGTQIFSGVFSGTPGVGSQMIWRGAAGGNTVLSGANTYSGPTLVDQGMLQLAAAGVIPDGSAVSLTNAGGIFDLNDFSETIGSLSGAGAVMLGTATLTTGGDNTSTTYSGVMSETGSLTKSGAGTLTLSGANTYTGTTTISAGTLSVATIGNGGVAGNLGQATNAAANVVFNGGTLQYTGATASTDRNFTITAATTGTIEVTTNTLTISGADTATTGALTKSGLGTLVLSGTNLHTGTTTITAGTVQIGAAGTAGSLSASSAITNNATLAFNRTDTLTQGTHFNSVISGSGAVVQAGSGTLVLNGANTYTGTTSVSAGTLSIISIKSVSGGASAVGAPITAGNGTIAIGSSTIAGTLVYTGTGDSSDRVINLAGTTGGATIDQSGTGVLSFTSALTATGVGAKTLTLQGSSAGTASITAAIVNGSGTTSLTKTGSGEWTLSGVNTYTGATTISAGTLLVVTGSTAAGSAVAVNSGGTLGGTGTVSGAITLASGGIIAPGAATGVSIGTLNTAAVTYVSGSTYSVDLNGTGPTADRITSSGTVALASATLTVASNANPAVGTVYTIVSGSSITGTFSGLANNAVFAQAGRLFRVVYTTTAVTLTDVAPTLTSRQTLDTNGNGRIDRIRLTFDRSLNDTFTGFMVAVTGYTVTGYVTGATANDAIIELQLTESGTQDTGVTPLVQITANTGLTDASGSGVIQVEGAATAATDAAAPVLMSSAWTDGDANGVDAGDAITLTFSESVTVTGAVIADLGLPVSGDTLSTTTLANQSGTTLSMTLAGSPLLTPGGAYGSGALTTGKPSGIFVANPLVVADAVGLNPATGNAASARDIGGSNLLAIAWVTGSNPKVWALGTTALGSAANTTAAVDLALRNVGDSTANLTIAVAVSAPSGWAPAAVAAGTDQFLLKVDNAGLPAADPTNPAAYELTLSTVGQSLISGLRSGLSTDFEFYLRTPTAITVGAGIQQTTTVTITAALPP